MKAVGNRKICSKCKIEKSTSDFFKAKMESDGLNCQCKDCISLYKSGKPYQGKLRDFNKTTKRKSFEYKDGTKLCHTCKEIKELSNFYFYNTSNSYNPKCKSCKNVESKCSLYNITREEYIKILESQNGLCAICNKSETNGRELAIDHCHKTNKVRGFLCMRCNVSLGNFNDDPDLLISALNYLKLRS